MSWQTSDRGTNAAEIPVEVGDVLAGKYRVERSLGVGGMGVVVAARHIDLGELRAVKFLRRELIDNGEVVERFLREARAVVKLRSPHVVRVHDVGRFDTGEPYIVMEYLEGEDLEAVIERGEPTPIRDAIDIVMQALAAMAEAHAAGIIHRDLKPANLFLARDSSGELCVKVLDFGISKLRDADGDQDMRMTSTDAIMGTPYYMSPEQMMSTRDVDERSDIWSIGIVLYELLSRQLPFKGSNIAAQCRLLLQTEPEPLAPASGEPLPLGFQQAIARFLLRDPGQRYADVLDAAEALAHFGGPASARALEAARRALGARRSAAAAAWASGAGGREPATLASLAVSSGHLSRPTLGKDSGGVSHPDSLADTTAAAGTPVGRAATLPSASDGSADEQMSRSTRAAWQKVAPAAAGKSRRLLVGFVAALVALGVAVLVVTLGDGAAPQPLRAPSEGAPPSPSAAPVADTATAEIPALPLPSAAPAVASAAASASAVPGSGPAPRPAATAARPVPRQPPTSTAPSPPPPAPSPTGKGDPFGSGRY